jgi:hypothetical protein
MTKVILKVYSSVGIMMRYGLDERDPIPIKRIFFFRSQRPDWLWDSMVLGSPSRRVKRSGRDVGPLQLVPRSRIMELYFHSPVRLYGMMLN